MEGFMTDPLLGAVRNIRKLYPDLKRSEISNDTLRNAVEQGGSALSKIMPLIEQYAHLRVRGHAAQPAFIAVFMAGTGNYLISILNLSVAGVDIIDSSAVYKSAYRAEWDSIDVDDLWNDHIAINEFQRLADDAGEDSKIGRAAIRMRDATLAFKSAMKGGIVKRHKAQSIR
jgi:hypothetical protein